ncbi:MAG: prenyltransferase/squalene oxidase repeat-containing protein, partial [Candidatus Acidiferrum sp.]
MNRRSVTARMSAATACFLALTIRQTCYAEELPAKYQAAANRGLEWLAKQQQRDGHWETHGQFHSAMTAMAGIDLLMEGSTMREGKYRLNIRRAVDYLVAHANHNGLIGDPKGANQGLGYLYGHGFSILFLSQLIGEEDDLERRAQLEDLLNRAVDFTCKAQT